MIFVARTLPPDVLARSALQWTADIARAGSVAERRRLQSKYRNKFIRAALEAMLHGKCAYCESKINHIDYAHIEHYRPKSLYIQLTFDWSNLLLACGKCNGVEQKGNKFPESSEGGPILDPCRDIPNEHLEFIFDPVAQIATVTSRTVRGMLTIELLGLNRPDLRTYRSNELKKLYVLADYAVTDSAARELLYEAIQSSAQYAAFARSLADTRDLSKVSG